MLSRIYREFANAVYLVSYQVQQYKARNNNVAVLAAGASKAQRLEKDADLRSGIGWVTARRAVLMLTNEKLICGSWEIRLSNIKEAKLLRIRSMFAKAFVLKVSTDDGYHYQFGLQYDPAWEQQTALKLFVEDAKIKRPLILSVYRIVVWVFLFALCGVSIWLMYLDFASGF